MEAFVLPVAVLAVAMTTLNYALQREPRVTHAAPASVLPDTGPVAPPRFDARLPTHLRGAAIHAVSAEDHYLRVHTDRGETLILMRLADAVAELEGVEGAQTHRSWWVARDAILDARRGEGRATLRLRGGTEAPVSRTYARSLREAGWFG
jgi:DNA-binding LytR/AlgR family response regulator